MREHVGVIDDLEAFDAVGDAGGAQRLERGKLALVMRDDELPASPMRHAVRGAELVHQTRALDAMPRLERSGWIVNACVNHLAVVCAGGQAGPRLFFEDADAVTAARHGQRRGESNHAASDDGGIDLFHVTCSLRSSVSGLRSLATVDWRP